MAVMGLAARPGRGVPAVHDAHGPRQTAGFPMARRTGTAWNGGDKPPGRLRVERMALRARGLRDGDGGPPRAGGGPGDRPRPKPTPTFDPGARRGTRRAPLRSEPLGGLVPPPNTWPHDRHDSQRGRPSVPPWSLAILRSVGRRYRGSPALRRFPVTSLPLPVRQPPHKTIDTPLRNGTPGTPRIRVRPRDDAAGGGRVNGCSGRCIVRYREVTDGRARRIQRRIRR